MGHILKAITNCIGRESANKKVNKAYKYRQLYKGWV